MESHHPTHTCPPFSAAAVGLTLTFEDFKRVLATPGRIFAGFALQYTIMPLMALAVSRLAGLPLDFAIGCVLVAACPTRAEGGRPALPRALCCA